MVILCDLTPEEKIVDLKTLFGSCYVTTAVISNDLLKRAMEAENEEKEKKALRSVQNLINSAVNSLKMEVQQLRQYRKLAKSQTDIVKKLDRSVQFFLTSGNPLPYLKVSGDGYGIRVFCNNVGIPVPQDDSEAYKVPDDFQPEPAGTAE